MFLNVLNLLIKITWRQKTNNNTDENKQNENNNNNNKKLKIKIKKREKENVVDSYKEFWYIYMWGRGPKFVYWALSPIW